VLQRKLTGVPPGGLYDVARKSPRKRVDTDVRVQGAAAARVLDVSNEGLRLQIERTSGAWLPLAFEIAFLTTDVTVPVNVVWKRRVAEGCWMCGAAVWPDHQDAWRALVGDLDVGE
jgi:hypothetical protein